MYRYRNLNGNSNVIAYDIGDDYVDVMFSGGSVYRYSYSSAGDADIERMKQLAAQGYGLNSFIMKHCRYKYESKRR